MEAKEELKILFKLYSIDESLNRDPELQSIQLMGNTRLHIVTQTFKKTANYRSSNDERLVPEKTYADVN